MNYIADKSLSKQEINYIIADCAIQMLLQQNNNKTRTENNYLKAYCNNNISFKSNNKLIDEFIDDKNNALNFIQNNPNFFKKYVYEKNEDILGLLYISLANLKLYFGTAIQND